MAHGGDSAWDAAVREVIAPLREGSPVEIAFGMADAASIQAAVSQLEAQGVSRIGVVRLFVSRSSWYDRTRQILGMAPGAPVPPTDESSTSHAMGRAGHAMGFWRIRSRASFDLSQEGLADAPEMGEVLVRRAQSLSRNPDREVVLVLAHGVGDESEDRQLVATLDERANLIRQRFPFREVRAMTLREDWPEQREVARRKIRGFVESANRAGLIPLVIPFRLQGFGPYAEVLQGLNYRADSIGLAPDRAVTSWVARESRRLREGASRELFAGQN